MKLFNFILQNYEGDIYIQKIDKNILEHSFENLDWNGKLKCSSEYYTIDLLLESGKIIENAVKIGEKTGYGRFQTIKKKGETIWKAIDRLKIGSKLRYILIYNNGYLKQNNQNKGWFRLTIYTVYPEVNLKNIILKLKKRKEY